MPSPFPGMDPYLEHPALWPDVHANLITAIQELLNRTIRPRYIARVERRVYLADDYDPDEPARRVPDVTVGLARAGAPAPAGGAAIAEPVLVAADPIKEGRVEVRDAATHAVVTVIEVLSHANKAAGSAGRRSFVAKRDEVLASPAHWVEIDLLRAGGGHRLRRRFRNHSYLVYSSPADLRPDAKAWPIRLAAPLPVVGVPLRAPDPDAPLDLGAALALAYDRAGYDADTDYAADPTPPLPPDLAAWADGVLTAAKLR